MRKKWGPFIGGILIGFIIMIMNYKHVVTSDEVIYRGNVVYEKTTDKPLTGTLKEYYENDQLKAKINYKKGKLDGNFSIYYPDGKLCQKGTYKKNVLHGKVKIYNEKGKLLRVIKYKKGFPLKIN